MRKYLCMSAPKSLTLLNQVLKFNLDKYLQTGMLGITPTSCGFPRAARDGFGSVALWLFSSGLDP